MSFGKRLLRTRPMQLALARVALLYLRLVILTARWEIVAPEATQRLIDQRRPFIFCFWHSRLMMMAVAKPRSMTAHALISEHRDGLLISRAVQGLGIHTIASARRRGGQSALRTMLRLLADGSWTGITPDGPRGPRMRAKAGAVKAAQISGAPLIPVSGTVSPRLLLRTWDRFCLALPFCRGVILMGEPIAVPRKASAADQEDVRRLLEERLNALTAEADARFGQATVAPAAPTERAKRTHGHARS